MVPRRNALAWNLFVATAAEMKAKFRALLDLGRVSNLPSVVTNVLAAWVLTGAGFGYDVVVVAIGAILLYLAGTTLNDAVDAKFDRLMPIL